MTEHILSAIDAEIARLRQARTLLAEGILRTKNSTSKKFPTGDSSRAPKRILSADARRAIAEAQRKRWAKVRGQKKTATAAKNEAVVS